MNSRGNGMRRVMAMGWTAGVLALLGVQAEAAVTITNWYTKACANVNGYTSWNIPQYNNEVDVGSRSAGTNASLVVSTSMHWTSNNTYVLKGPILFVAPAVLYVDPGTVIRCMPWTDPSVTLPGSITIGQGAKIIARGTVTHPIIWTSVWDNNVPGMTPGTCDLNGGSSAPGWPGSALDAAPSYFLDGPRDYSVWQPAFDYWGGVQIMGRCPVTIDNADTNAVKTTQLGYIEGLPNYAQTQYGQGPLDDDDDSGVFAYNQIRYNGFPMAANKELNGLSLYGVGRETEIHHNEMMNPFDDGIEWFGGSVNTKYIVCWAYGDDGLDSDEGYRGKSQFDFCVQGAVRDIVVNQNNGGAGGGYIKMIGSGCSDKGMEVDSGTANEMGVPLALATWYNVTHIGKGPTNGIPFTASDLDWKARSSDQIDANTGVLMRDAAASQIRNSLFLEFRGAGIVIEARTDKVNNGFAFDCLDNAKRAWNVFPANTNTILNNGVIYQAQSDGMQLECKNNVYWHLGGMMAPVNTNDILRAGGYEQSTWPTAPLHLDGYNAWNVAPSIDVNFADAKYSNIVANASVCPIGHIYRDLRTTSPMFAKNVYAVTNVNPCPVTADCFNAPPPPADGFFSPVTYKGAFAPDYNWMAGWTLAEKLGLVDTSMNQVGEVGDSGIVTAPTISVIGPYPSIKFSSEDGARYRIEGTTNIAAVTWTTLGHATGNGGDVWFADQTGAPVSFMRVVHEN